MKKWADLGLKQVTIAYETKNKMLTAKGAVTGTAQDIVGIAPNSHTTFLCLSQEDGKIGACGCGRTPAHLRRR